MPWSSVHRRTYGGRTPEYVGKKIEQKEVKMAIIAVLATSLVDPRVHGLKLCGPICQRTVIGIPRGPATANSNNGGGDGFPEVLYAYTSGAGNNGSAFAGINANTPWYNMTMGIDMLIGDFFSSSRTGDCGESG